MKGSTHKMFRAAMLVLVAMLVLAAPVSAGKPPAGQALNVKSWGYYTLAGDLQYARFFADTITWKGYPAATHLALGFSFTDEWGNTGERNVIVPIKAKPMRYSHIEAPGAGPDGQQSWMTFYDCSAATGGNSHPFVQLLSVVENADGSFSESVLVETTGVIADLVNFCIS